MATETKSRLLARAEDAGLEVEVRGGGWFVVEGTKVRGLDDLEATIDAALNAPDESPCWCGCGKQVSRRFAQGHDARLKSILLKVARHEMGPPAIPEEALPHLEVLGSLLGQHEESIDDVLAVVRGAS